MPHIAYLVEVFQGTITIWHGAVADIPGGRALCDGSNGTPDLRDKFIAGAGGAEYSPGDQGGAKTMPHTHTGPSHAHTGPSHTHTGPNHRHIAPEHDHIMASHKHTLADWINIPDVGYGAYIADDGEALRVLEPGATIYARKKAITDNPDPAITTPGGLDNTGYGGTGPTGADGTGSTGAGGTGATGGASNQENRPPYYALCYIMKL